MKPDKAPFLPIMCKIYSKFLPIMWNFYSKFLPIMCKRFSNQFTMREMEMDVVFCSKNV